MLDVRQTGEYTAWFSSLRDRSVQARLQAAIDEAGDDAEFIAKTLGDVARSRGMASVARASGLSREGLYKALGEGGNPTFATVLCVLRALGMQLKIEAAIEGS
jgi:probable addiction module antidote protein